MNRAFLCNSKGIPVVDELDHRCKDCIHQQNEQTLACPIDSKPARTKKQINADGTVFVCSKKQGFVKSTKHFSHVFEKWTLALKDLSSKKADLESQYKESFKRMAHNLVSHNGHILQEIQNLVPETDLLISSRQLHVLEEAIASDKKGVAKAILMILQSAVGVKHEITIYSKLYSSEDIRLKFERHSIHKVFMNSAYKFFQDFHEKNIRINVGQSTCDVLIDYESISVVLYHILENSKKYTLQNTDIDVTFSESSHHVTVQLDMHSMKITANDMEHLYEEGYSGEYARKNNLSGSGYGMNVVKKLLKLNRSMINLIPNVNAGTAVLLDGQPYEWNRFLISIPKAN